MDFSETIIIYDLKLATDDRSAKTFLLTSKLCPLGAVCPCPGAIKSWKKLYKIRLQRDFFETCNKWPKWQDVPDDIKISSLRSCPPCPGAIYMYKIMKKKCITSDFKEIFFKLVANEWSDKTFLLTSKLCPLGAVCPCPGAIYMYKIVKKIV